jgi:hypothetical protein
MCDTLCVLGPSGLLFAKNSDRPPSEPQVVESFGARPSGGVLHTQYLELPDSGAAAFIGSRPTWLWGVEHGLNEHGVAIGNEKIWTIGRPRTRPPALLGMDIVRLGLERSRTADEALQAMTDLITQFGQGGSGERDHDEPYDSSFLIADRGGGWILETCDRTWAARPIGTGAAISNRISLERDWTLASADVPPGTDFQAWRDPEVPTTIADHRLAATQACVARGAEHLAPAEMVAALRSHGAGPWGVPGEPARVVDAIPDAPGEDYRGVTVCMHVRGYQATTAAMVCAVGADASMPPRAWVALGSPCASVFVPVFPAAGIPAPLSDAATWSRFAALRDRVEADPDALSSIRGQLAPVEAELWHRADAVELGDAPAQRAYTVEAFDTVEHALRTLSL